MAASSEYWRSRAEFVEDAKNRAAGLYTSEIERQFNLARKTLDEQIEQWYGRFAANNGITLAEARKQLAGKDLSEFKWDVNEYIKHGREAALNPEFVKQLENASARFHISRLDALKLKTQNTVETLYNGLLTDTESQFGKIYKDSYYHTAFELQKGFNIGFDIAAPNNKHIESVLSKPWTLDGRTFSDRVWTHKNELIAEIHTRLTQNAILGTPPDEAIRAIAKRFNVSKHKAGRLVMTESAYFMIAAQIDAYKTLDVEEFEIIGTLDSSICPECGSLDGVHMPVSRFEAGVTAPPFHCFCRCCTSPYFSDLGGERFARDAEGKGYYVPADMTYTEWKEKFVDGGDKNGLKTATESNKIKSVHDVESFVDLQTYMSNTYGVKVADELEKLHFQSIKESTIGIERVMQEFPQLNGHFSQLNEMKLKGAVADCDIDGIIGYSPHYYSDAQKAAYAVKNDSGFHPPNHSLEGVGLHEAGHLIEGYLLKMDDRFPLKNIGWADCSEAKEIVSEACKAVKKTPLGRGKRNIDLMREISGYATYGKLPQSETLAEAVEDWFINGERAAPLSREILKILKRRLS